MGFWEFWGNFGDLLYGFGGARVQGFSFGPSARCFGGLAPQPSAFMIPCLGHRSRSTRLRVEQCDW